MTAQKIEAKLIHTGKYYSDHLTAPENTFILTTTSLIANEDVIKTLSLGKALRPNSILTKLLKQFSKTITILTIISIISTPIAFLLNY